MMLPDGGLMLKGEEMMKQLVSDFVSWAASSWGHVFIIIAVVLFAPTAVTLIWKVLFGYHAQMKREAKDIWKRVQKTASDRDVFILLRAMEPFAFEELVVRSLRKHGYRAWHGSRYTGDRGIDGWVRFSHEKHPIQDKRYSGAINPQHVREFSRLCCSRGVTGLFIHTGTTGNASRDAAVNVRIISGRLLIDLVRKDCPFEL